MTTFFVHNMQDGVAVSFGSFSALSADDALPPLDDGSKADEVLSPPSRLDPKSSKAGFDSFAGPYSGTKALVGPQGMARTKKQQAHRWRKSMLPSLVRRTQHDASSFASVRSCQDSMMLMWSAAPMIPFSAIESDDDDSMPERSSATPMPGHLVASDRLGQLHGAEDEYDDFQVGWVVDVALAWAVNSAVKLAIM